MRLRAESAWAAARSVGGSGVLLALAAPLALAAAAVAAGRVGAIRAVEAWSVRGWALGLGVALACSALHALRARDGASALARVAALCALVQPFAWAASRVEGTVDLGEHEEDPPWRALSRGPLASMPALSVDELDGGADGPVALRVDGRVHRVPLGRRVPVGGGVSIEVHGPFPAPRFTVTRASGEAEVEGLVKLQPGAREYLEPGILPHRLYLSVPAGEDALSPAKLHLRVQRGKLRVLEREVAAGEDVAFEGVAFRFSDGAAWIRVEVRKEPRPWLLGAGAALASLAGALAWRCRRAGP